MNILQYVIAKIRKEQTLGENLRHYEKARYVADDYVTDWQRYHVVKDGEVYRIVVDPDAETFADVSMYQDGMDWSKYPHRAAIIRIGQNTWKDIAFEYHYNEAKVKRGIALGGYWFYDDRVSPQAQANVLIAACAGKSFELEIFIDYEKVYGGAYQGTANVKKLIDLVKASGVKCYAVGVYTGYYFWLDHASIGDYPYFAPLPLWLAWYNVASIVKVPAPFLSWTHWQYGTPTVNWGQPTAEIDANKSNGSKSDFESKYLGGSGNTDVTTQPKPGMTTITGERSGYKFTLDIYDPAKWRFEVAHVTTPDRLEITSTVVRDKGADGGYNGGEWNKYVSPYMPLDYSVSNSVLYKASEGVFRPSLIVENDSITIDTVPHKGAQQALTGLRFLVQGGGIPTYLDNPEYQEGHAVTCFGYNANGFMMVLTCEGTYASGVHYGMTLKQDAEVLKQYGAVYAFDGGGGGDTTRVIDGIVTNVPQDGNERRIPEFFLVYAKDGDMANGIAQEALGNVAKVRDIPSRYGREMYQVPARGQVEFVEYVNVQIMGTADKPGEMWLKLSDGFFVNWRLFNTAGMLVDYFTIVQEPVVTPPPAVGNMHAELDFLDDGTVTGTWQQL